MISLLTAAAAIASITATTNFTARAKAEAVRRLEAEQFEEAVQIEIKHLRRERWSQEQAPAFLKYHQDRKAHIKQLLFEGQISEETANIETSICEHVLGRMSEAELLGFIKLIDKGYLYRFANARDSYALQEFMNEKFRRGSTTPDRIFQTYLQFARGNLVELDYPHNIKINGILSAEERIRAFESMSPIKCRA